VPTNLTLMEDQATTEAPSSSPSNPGVDTGAAPGPGQFDWPAKVADTVEDVVTAVHDRLVRPLTVVARALVFGIIIGVMGIVLAALTVIIVIRLLDVYAFRGRVWASDALVGGLLVAAGGFAWSKRGARGAGEG